MKGTKPVLCVAAKAVLVNKQGQVLVMRESPKHATNTKAGHYQLPGGRLEPGEAFWDGLRREVREETGLEIEIGRPLLVGEWRPTILGVPHQIVGMFVACKPKGGDITISEEHDEYLWIDPRAYADFDIVSPDDQAIAAYVEQLAKT